MSDSKTMQEEIPDSIETKEGGERKETPQKTQPQKGKQKQKAKDIKDCLNGTTVEEESSLWIPSGSDLVDVMVGGGRGYGYQGGQVINIPAPSGAGKTLLCCEVIANAYHRFKDKCKWIYDDCESGNTFDTKELYGIEIIPENPDEAVRSPTIELCFTNVLSFLESLKEDEFGIYVIDSIDGLVSDEIEDMTEDRMKAAKAGKDYDKGSYQGGKPKFLSSQFLPIVAREASKKRCLVLIVSQLRDNIGGGLYAPKDRVSNGRALFYYSHAQVWVKVKQKLENKGRDVGAVLEVYTKKLKGPRPFRSCMITIHFRRGIDNTGSNIDYLYELRTPEKGELKKKALCEWDGEEYTRDELIAYIEENCLEKELTARVLDKWEAEEKEAEAPVVGRKKRF